MVTTSPKRTGWLVAAIRSPLSRTLPPFTSAAAAVRVRTTRVCHNHLSMRWRSVRSAFLQLFLQCGELREWRIRIRLAAALLRVDPLARLAAIPILEVAPAALGAWRPIATITIRAFAATALARRRTSFGAWLGSVTALAA